MIKYLGYTIVLQEVPNEVSLAINIANCPNRCKGCHSPELQKDVGRDLLEDLPHLLKKYGDAITCVCFMGVGNDYPALLECNYQSQQAGFKTCLYTGDERPNPFYDLFNYVKTGPYIETLGGLSSPTTNQRMYKTENHKWIDITEQFWNRKKEID